MSRPYRCTRCGAGGVKLWRLYQTLADETPLYCRACAQHDQETVLDGDQIGWLVPAVPAPGDTFWGYTSVPDEDVRWWKALPALAPDTAKEGT